MALAVYAKQALNQEAEKQAAEIRLRAEIRAGELLAEMRDAGQRAKPGDAGGGTDGRGVRPSVSPALTDLGITKDQSSQWQQVAAIPKRERETYIAESPIPTASGLLSSHKAKRAPKESAPKMDPDALWVWGRMCDFETVSQCHFPFFLVISKLSLDRLDVDLDLPFLFVRFICVTCIVQRAPNIPFAMPSLVNPDVVSASRTLQ